MIESKLYQWDLQRGPKRRREQTRYEDMRGEGVTPVPVNCRDLSCGPVLTIYTFYYPRTCHL